MAKYIVTCIKCGQDYETQLVGKMKTRQFKLDHWNGICENCKAEKARKESEGSDLIGSPKQIVWAMKIRKDFFENIDDEEIDDFAEDLDCKKDVIINTLNKIRDIKKAAIWIRYNGSIEVLMKLVIDGKIDIG